MATMRSILAQLGADLQIVSFAGLESQQPNQNIKAVISFFPLESKHVEQISRAFGSDKIPLFQFVENGTEDQSPPDWLPIAGLVFSPITVFQMRFVLKTAEETRRRHQQTKDLVAEIFKYREQKTRLLRIGAALSAEHDLDRLLNLILLESRSFLRADAGSIYIKEMADPGQKKPGPRKAERIIFKIAQNDSVEMQEKSKEFPIEIGLGTIAGYVAFTNEVLNLPDVYSLDDDVPFRFGRDFDTRFGYRTKSMLTVPLENRNGEIVGVLQLINKKKNNEDRIAGIEDVDKIESFTSTDEEIILSLGSQAAVAIEKAQLYHSIEVLFKGFVESSIAAIEARDEATFGHSEHVRAYALKMAELINEKKEGPFKDIYFDAAACKELEYAALLHDIGKIGVREAVLVKPKRLADEVLEAIECRWRYWGVCSGGPSAQAETEEIVSFLHQINGTGFLDDAAKAKLDSLRVRSYLAPDGRTTPYLTEREYAHLSVRRGNLTDDERRMINFHAECTRQILSRMPWTRELEGVTHIACHHHEKLDGSGYPDGLKGDEIPLQSRILAAVDIFEALVAQDRPYKPPMPVDKALSILRAEADANRIDRNIVDLFIEEKVYDFIDLRSAKKSPAAS